MEMKVERDKFKGDTDFGMLQSVDSIFRLVSENNDHLYQLLSLLFSLPLIARRKCQRAIAECLWNHDCTQCLYRSIPVIRSSYNIRLRPISIPG
jgi:hypothetical protein